MKHTIKQKKSNTAHAVLSDIHSSLGGDIKFAPTIYLDHAALPRGCENGTLVGTIHSLGSYNIQDFSLEIADDSGAFRLEKNKLFVLDSTKIDHLASEVIVSIVFTDPFCSHEAQDLEIQIIDEK